MSGFTKSLDPLLKRLRLKKYLVEVILLTVALVITIISLTVYGKNYQENTNNEELVNDQPEQIMSENIIVDVSGAVQKPNIYKIGFGARIKDVIDKAGGLSDDADVLFFHRNFNLARIVVDQEKIYVPSISEINNGIFIQGQLVFDYNSPSLAKTNLAPSESQSLISISDSTIEELDQLPGIGQITANKIISNRPYTTIEDLLTKKVVNKGVFEKIKNLIEI